MLESRGRFVLLYPSTFPEHPGHDGEIDTTFNCLPIGVLCLASFLKSEGYEVKVIDGRLYDKAEVRRRLEEDLDGAIAFGISAVTGQLAHGLALGDEVKAKRPFLPIILGGIHPTLFPDQTLADHVVDYIVQGEGEFALRDLLEHIRGGEVGLPSIRGLGWKDERGKCHINAPAEPLDIRLLPKPDYGLLDVERYLDRTLYYYTRQEKVRGLDIYTSRGCPYRCSFCTNTLKSFKRWRALKIEDVLDTISSLVKQYDLDYVKFTDDYLFGNKRYGRALVNGLIEADLDVRWLGNIRVDCFDRDVIEEEDLARLKESGCIFLNVGIESGSPRMLKKMKKDITPEQALDFFERCCRWDISPLATFMIGIPGETMSDMKLTITLMDKLFAVCPQAILSPPGVFRPYPGTELYEETKSLGFREPSSLRQWAAYDFGDSTSNFFISSKDLPWVKNRGFIRDLGHYMFWYFDFLANGDEPRFSRLRKMFGALSRFRIRHDIWFFRFEPFLARIRSRVRQKS